MKILRISRNPLVTSSLRLRKEETMKKRIHINQHNIKHNNKNPENKKPVVTIKTYKSNDYAYCVVHIDGPAKIVYSPDKPLSCGAKVWIETESDLTWI